MYITGICCFLSFFPVAVWEVKICWKKREVMSFKYYLCDKVVSCIPLLFFCSSSDWLRVRVRVETVLCIKTWHLKNRSIKHSLKNVCNTKHTHGFKLFNCIVVLASSLEWSEEYLQHQIGVVVNLGSVGGNHGASEWEEQFHTLLFIFFSPLKAKLHDFINT